MYTAHFSYTDWQAYPLRKVVTKKVEISEPSAAEFMKRIKGYGDNFSLKNCRDCSIDGIKVKPGHFLSQLKIEQEETHVRRFKEVDPFQHFGFTQLEIDLYGLKKAGREILVRKPANEDAFFKKLEETQSGGILTLYHGTNSTNIKSILGSGLSASRQGSFGRGLYVGPFDKAKGYNGRDGNKVKWRQKRNYFATIFELDVIVGNCIKAEKLEKHNWRTLYDSVYYDGFRNPEYCLKSPHQALIKKIILL